MAHPDVKESSYNGYPSLGIKVGENRTTGAPYYFYLSFSKARAIIKNLDAVREFVDRYSKYQKNSRKDG